MGNIINNNEIEDNMIGFKIFARKDISFEEYTKTADFEKQSFYAVPEDIISSDGTVLSNYRFYIGDNEITMPLKYANLTTLASNVGDNHLVKGELLKSYVTNQITDSNNIVEIKSDNNTIFEAGKLYYNLSSSGDGNSPDLKFCYSTIDGNKFIELTESCQSILETTINEICV